MSAIILENELGNAELLHRSKSELYYVKNETQQKDKKPFGKLN